ncbi:universal stress protein [Paraburkholderia sp. MMS20-SJTN17]|uniref:Universal stress protein n=1 Tax=Paraburkholderia translucens TaxID=2886945 RepID=A0ABS8KCI4_9BURK|nr:universal stress protein [Paraburkholderia sp. MMS20-SJTN17]MCC8402465.1 universal stress protein [Paraburkholderia sp. MMS20-SJTN17]
MCSFSRLLLVYDGTSEAKAALERCSRLSLALRAPVDVVAVVDAESANAICGGLLADVAYVHLEEVARKSLSDAVRQLAQIGVRANGSVEYGRIADVVARHAQTFNPDLIVLGHRARARRARWWNARPVHVDLAERLAGATIVTVTLESAQT